MTTTIRSIGAAILVAAAFACLTATASAGITVGPAGANIVALSTNTVLAEPGVTISCTNASAVGTVPTAPNNTSLTGPINVPILLYFGPQDGSASTCSSTFAGNTVPVTVTSLDTTPGDHTLSVAQDHSLSVGVSADMITITIPALGCSIVIGATTVPVTLAGSLSMVTGFNVAGAAIPRLSDTCGLSGASTFSGNYTIAANTGTMLAPVMGAATLLTVTDLS